METALVRAKHIVAGVVCALIYGSAVLISNFLPKFFGLQLIYLPAAIAPPLGVWFGLWGCLGNLTGNVLSSVTLGRNPVVSPLIYIAQFVYGAVPGVMYRKPNIDTKTDLILFTFWSAVGSLVGTLLVALQVQITGMIPRHVIWRVLWPSIFITNAATACLGSPLIMRRLSSYIVKSGLLFRTFLG